MMPTCKMNETKLEVNENYEEAELSDVDDDVFVRSGGRNGFRLELYDNAKKPLMNPRRKTNGFDVRNGGFHTEVRSSPPALRMLCMPICYILIATFAMLGVIAVIAFLSHYISIPLSVIRFWKKSAESTSSLLPCDKFQVEDVWVRKFPKMLTESAFRVFDANKDGVDDIVFGYATGADGYNVPKFVCDIYFPGQDPCYGGVIALDGRDGSELWKHWTDHEVFGLNCNEDISKDGTPDCLISGRAGVFCAINGRDGSLLWSFLDGPAKNPIMNIYTPQFIRDLNNDGYLDIFAVHGGDPLAEPGSRSRLSGRLLLISGKDGQILQWMGTPDQQESYYSPQLLTRPDGTDLVLFGTGGETHPGGLYVISLQDLHKGLIANAKLIYKDERKGIMVPPVITDVNGDGMDDIVMAMFNSTVVAFDGNTFQQIWNHTFPSSETYTTPTPGYYNEDPTPDFLVKYQTGPGFPIYYHAQTTVLDGKTGKPFLENPIIDSIGSQASTPLIRVQGYGNDIFLFWSSNCKGFEGNSTQFSFAKGTTVHEQSRSDFCKLRFDSTLINQLHMFNRATGLPGTVVYDSDSRRETEYNGTLDTSLEGQAYLQTHPEMWKYYGGGEEASQAEYKSVQPSPRPSGESSVIENYGPLDLEQRQMGPGRLLDVPLSQSGDPDGQIEYRTNGIPYGPNLPPYGIPLSSQPELTENVKYPMYHSVRKHGKFQAPAQLDMNAPITVNRRGRLEQGRSVTDRDTEASAMWRDFYGSPGTKHSAGLKSPYNVPSEDLAGMQYGYETREGNPEPLNNPMFSQWRGSKRQSSDYIYGSRGKRHIGPHDMDGIQRLISTGTLAKPLNGSSAGGIDLIFGTYWFFPAKTQGILPKDRDCIQQKMSIESQRFEETSKYFGMDHDQYEDTVTKECIAEGGVDEDGDGESTFESQSTYNPFDIHMGQMTVYRLHISCSCSPASLQSKTVSGVKARCARILPYEDQPWSAYMGSAADSYFPFRPSPPLTPKLTKP